MENNTLAAELLNKLQADEELADRLTSESIEWDFQPDASYDDGWTDESLWIRRDVEIYGQRVTLYAKPEYDGREKQLVTIGEISALEVTR